MDGNSAGAAKDARSIDLLRGFSLEIMPRTAAKIDDFRAILPQETLVYIAHIDGTEIDDMVATAQRLSSQGFEVMPHLPARSIPDRSTLDAWLRRYREEAGVTAALVLAGGAPSRAGTFSNAMDLLETGLFEEHGYAKLHVAGHPEGNRDIDPDGSSAQADRALAWKQEFADRTGIGMAVVTQFLFDAEPAVQWTERLRASGITLPIHLGIAGPTKLQTLIKFAIACGVGPSLGVLKKRALDLTKLLVPFEPTDLLEQMTEAKRDGRLDLEKIHIFPLGGIRNAARYAAERTGWEVD